MIYVKGIGFKECHTLWTNNGTARINKHLEQHLTCGINNITATGKEIRKLTIDTPVKRVLPTLG